MPESASRRDPLDGIAPISARGRLSIVAAPRGCRLVLRGSDNAAAAAGRGFGLALPHELNRATTDGARTAFKLGPDEWLLLGPEGEEAGIFARIEAATTELHALVDVSHRNVGIMIDGALAPDLLNAGVMLDLDLAAFPVGMATRTLFAKAEIVLWRKAPSSFHIEVWRSFAPYLHGHLTEASLEYIKT